VCPKKKRHFTITEVNWLKLFKEAVPIFTANLAKSVSTEWGIKEIYDGRKLLNCVKIFSTWVVFDLS
jgi:hypothetical protein